MGDTVSLKKPRKKHMRKLIFLKKMRKLKTWEERNLPIKGINHTRKVFSKT